MSEKMSAEEEAEIKVHEIMYDIVSLLNSHGITSVRAGAVMRLLGTDNEEARMFDDKILFIVGDAVDMRDVDQSLDDVDEDADSDRTLH